MKRFAFLCVGMVLLTSMVGCCLHGQCGGYGRGYGCGYGNACPGGGCGTGVPGAYPGTLTIPPQGAAIGGFNSVQVTTPYGAPMTAANPYAYPQTASFSGTSVTPLETLPTY